MIAGLLGTFREKRKLNKFRKYWRDNNQHNLTWAENKFDSEKVSIGNKTYGPLQIVCYGSNNCNLKIGAYCSISHNVKFLLGGEHDYHVVSTYPFQNNIFKKQLDTGNKGDIVIEDDTWIGENVLILSGVKIGQGAVIAAGSVVVKEIPAYAIAGGNPAKVIKYRCSKDRCKELLHCDYSQLTEQMIRKHIQDLYKNIEKSDISWFPKK